MSTLTIPRLTAVALATAALVVPSGAEAAGYECSASALRATVLGQVVEPVRAGTPGACADDLRTLDTLAAPLAGRAALARTGIAGGRAGAGTSVSSFRAGALAALAGELPQVPLPDGIGALHVPLPESAALLGLPAAITVDATQAARQLVTARSLPDVPLVAADLVQTAVTAGCQATGLVFDAVARVETLTGLGRPLSTDRAVDDVVELAAAQSVDFSTLDVGLVELPAGLSLGDPVTGPVLRAAIQSVVDGLPVRGVPAAVGRVTVEPARREDGAASARQLGPRVKVEALGRQLADVTLGDALVSALGVVCGEAPAPTSPATELALACARADVVLTDVLDKDGRVRLVGAAAPKHVGQTVSIVLTHTGKRVATAVVQPDGSFRATAPLPPKAIRYTNHARYQAAIGTQRSLALKLHRRMRISRILRAPGEVTIIGRVYGPRAEDRVRIARRESCTRDVDVVTVTPKENGWWRVTLPVPPGLEAATYRATSEVRNPGSPRSFRTFTLPGFVALK